MLIGNEYTTEGREVYIDFMEPLGGVQVRRHCLFATCAHNSQADKVARLMNKDNQENMVHSMKMGPSLLNRGEIDKCLKQAADRA